jgi:lariat debranching enzyme
MTFDPEWLAITRAFHPYLSTTRDQPAFPDETQARDMVRRELEWVTQNIVTHPKGSLSVADCQRFAMTAPGPGQEGNAKMKQRNSRVTPCL